MENEETMAAKAEHITVGILAEFDTATALVRACVEMRDAGYSRWDAHTPFPLHGLDDAMGLRTTKLPRLVLGGGIVGGGLGLLLQYWTNAVDYPVIISGKPIFSIPANIPVMFELTILLAAISAFVGMLALNGLPRYHHPVFSSASFRRVTTDRFFISVEAVDPLFDQKKTRELLEGAGSMGVEDLHEEGSQA